MPREIHPWRWHEWPSLTIITSVLIVILGWLLTNQEIDRLKFSIPGWCLRKAVNWTDTCDFQHWPLFLQPFSSNLQVLTSTVWIFNVLNISLGILQNWSFRYFVSYVTNSLKQAKAVLVSWLVDRIYPYQVLHKYQVRLEILVWWTIISFEGLWIEPLGSENPRLW